MRIFSTTVNFYPRSPCGERHYLPEVVSINHDISIHALLAESDPSNCFTSSPLSTISIHALLAESDWAAITLREVLAYFYPRSPCGERQQRIFYTNFLINFYPRSPCGERLTLKSSTMLRVAFLSTLSLRRATYYIHNQELYYPNFYPRSPCGERQWERQRR